MDWPIRSWAAGWSTCPVTCSRGATEFRVLRSLPLSSHKLHASRRPPSHELHASRRPPSHELHASRRPPSSDGSDAGQSGEAKCPVARRSMPAWSTLRDGHRLFSALGYHRTCTASGGRPGHEPPTRASPPRPDPTPAANQREAGPVAYSENMRSDHQLLSKLAELGLCRASASIEPLPGGITNCQPSLAGRA